MSQRLLLFLTIIFLIDSHQGLATHIPDTLRLQTEMLTVQDGLSQGLVFCVLQDKEGFLWFSTKDGLNKYDGYQFTVYRHQPDNLNSMPGTFIIGMVEDDNGNLWVGTRSRGLYVFDRREEEFREVKLKKSPLPFEGEIVPIQYEDGKLLVRSDVNVIYDVSRIHPGNYASLDLSKEKIYLDDREILHPSENTQSGYSFLQWMDNNSIWYSNADSLMVLGPATDSIYRRTNLFASTQIGFEQHESYFVKELPQDNRFLFMATKSAIVFDFQTQRVVKKFVFDDAYPFPRTGHKDKTGNYYISGEPDYFYFNSTDYSVAPVKGKAGGISDRNGILWMGTMGYGVIKYDSRKQRFKTIVRTGENRFFVTQNGDKMVAMQGKPLEFYNLYANESRPILPTGIWNPKWRFYEIITTKSGDNWIYYYNQNDGSWHLILHHPSNNQVEEIPVNQYNIGNPTKLMVDIHDNLWVNSIDKNGHTLITRINKNKDHQQNIYYFPCDLEQNFEGYFVSSYYQDNNDVFWFATMQGLFSFSEEKQQWQHWVFEPGNAQSLNNNQLYCIAPDPLQPDRFLWVGTNGGGFSRLEKATGIFEHFNETNGLPNNVVYGMLSDNAGNLWLSTNNGLSCFNPQAKTFMNFNVEDGLPGNEFNRYEFYKMPNGDLFFGGIEGGIFFTPEKVLEKDLPPSIVLTGLSIFNKPVSYKTDSDIIEMPITYADKIILSHDKAMFSISFAALEYRTTSKKNYKYFLEGYDKDWIESGHKNEATYTNLPPGTYTFHVTGAGRDNVWNEKGASIVVIILPAWWQTWIFRLSLALVIAFLLYALYRYRLFQTMKIQTIRNRIASDLHDEIGSTLSSISISSAIIQQKIKNENSEVGGFLNQISTNTDNMMEAMSDIVWTIKTTNDSIDNVINRMRAFAVEILEPKNCILHFDTAGITTETKLDMEQRKNIYLIFKEAVNNAAKYASCKNVWITIVPTGNRNLTITITDDGVGFITTKEDPVVDSNKSLGGNGLSNMRKRAKEIKGELNIRSAIDQGTTITLQIPV